MNFSYDINNKLKQSKMFLANPQKKYIGNIIGAENVKLILKFNSLHELTFIIYENKNNEYTEFYDDIVKMKLIELQYISWFQIQSAVEKQDENSKERYKEVKCYSLENELVYKKIYEVNGVFELYNPLDRENSLLSIVADASGWEIGHVDNDLLATFRTFDVSSEQIYNFLTNTVSKSYDCCFKFDTYSRSINCYKLSNMGELTNILISRQNIMKEYIKEDSESAIITKLRIRGADGVDIRAVNPNGTNYRVNLDYFMTTNWGFSQETIDAWNTYKIKSASLSTSYSSILLTLKSKKSELLTLQTELTDLESLKSAQEKVMGTSVQLHGRVPIVGDSDYTIYQNAVTLVSSYITQIASKNSEIILKQSEIDIIQASLDNISVDLDWSTNFTAEQIAEIKMFITEDQDYEDSTFVISDIMSETEAIDIKLELMQYGDNELARASQPQYTYSTTASNLFNICDNKDELVSYDSWREQFVLGNLICIKFRDDYNTIARLMQISVDFDNLSDIGLLFSDKSRLDDALIQLAEVISTSSKSATSYSLSKIGYDKAKNQVSEVRKFINGSLNATLNSVKNNDNIETLLDEFGLHGKKWLPDQNKYDDCQLWLNNQNLLFTDDGWKSAQTAIGKILLESGETVYGVISDVIIGRLIMSEKLFIDNSSGTYTINDDGIIASASITKEEVTDIYSVGINPSNPSEIINVKVNEENLLYVDTDARQLVMQNSSIKASSFIGGSIESDNYTVDELDENIILTGTKIDLSNGNIYSKNFSVIDGDATFKGHIEAESGEIAGFKVIKEDETTHNGGLIYEDRETGKYIRISPYSYHEGGGEYDTEYGSIDLGTVDAEGNVKTLAHLRSNGYVRFGLLSEGGTSVRFNDFLVWDETSGDKGTDTIMYSQNFQIDRDGTVHIKSDDLQKAWTHMQVTRDNGYITNIEQTSDDGTIINVDIIWDVNDDIVQIGDGIIEYTDI